MEPTEGQLALYEVLMDMKAGEIVTVRGIHTHMTYYITSAEPFIGNGRVTVLDPRTGIEHYEEIPNVLGFMELEDVDIADEYMVSVDGMQAPSVVHKTYDSACDEADRLARKNLGKRVRVLKVEHVIMAKQHVEVKECL